MCPLCVIYFDVRWVPGASSLPMCLTLEPFYIYSHGAVGLPQVEVADYENTDNCSANSRSRVPRRGYHWLLSRNMDPTHDYFVCPCVIIYYYWCERIVSNRFLGAASFTIYTRTKELFRDYNYLNRNNVVDAALVGGIGGAMSGSLISFGSARELKILPRRNSFTDGNMA